MVLHSIVYSTNSYDAYNEGNNSGNEEANSDAEPGQVDQESSDSTSLWCEVCTVDSEPELWSDPEHPEWIEGGRVTVDAEAIEELSDDESSFLGNSENTKLTIPNKCFC